MFAKLQRELGEIPACPNPEAGLGCLALRFASSVLPAEPEGESEAGPVGEENCLSHRQTGCGAGGLPSGYFLLFSPWLCKSSMSCSFCPSGVSKPLAHRVLAGCQGLVEQWPYYVSPAFFTGVPVSDSVALT